MEESLIELIRRLNPNLNLGAQGWKYRARGGRWIKTLVLPAEAARSIHQGWGRGDLLTPDGRTLSIAEFKRLYALAQAPTPENTMKVTITPPTNRPSRPETIIPGDLWRSKTPFPPGIWVPKDSSDDPHSFIIATNSTPNTDASPGAVGVFFYSDPTSSYVILHTPFDGMYEKEWVRAEPGTTFTFTA